MEGLLSRFTGMLTTHPGAVVALGVAVLFTAMVWAVLANSYRYR